MEVLHSIFGNDLNAAATIVFTLIIIESLLSIDNAAVLATMVMDLPKEQRGKALKYGIIGAYVFRGICLVLASWLIKIWWLKLVGGLYLLYLMIHYFISKATPRTEEDIIDIDKKSNFIYRNTLGLFGKFWSTVIMIEAMDLAFSMDNVFAVVAFTDNIWLITIGVFIGILAMRFVAQGFVKLMEKYPFLEKAAFIVIGVLGLKLTFSVYSHFYPEELISKIMEHHDADLYLSFLTVGIFIVPILTSWLFGYPKRND